MIARELGNIIVASNNHSNMSVLSLADIAAYSVVERTSSTLSVVLMLPKFLFIPIFSPPVVKCFMVCTVNKIGKLETKSKMPRLEG